MNETNESFSLRISGKLLFFLKKFANGSKTAFIREAIAEKLIRDCGVSLTRSDFLITQGKRTDLDTPEKRAAKLPALREQARKARESKQGGKE